MTHTEATLRDLCQFLGEDYTPQLLDYHKTEHPWYSDKIEKPEAIKTHDDHNTNRNWQINPPIFSGKTAVQKLPRPTLVGTIRLCR